MPRLDRPTLPLQAVAGQPLAIVLDAQPAAGLQWQAPAAPAGCQLVADGQAPGGAGDGSGVQQCFRFTAAAPGSHTLRFVLQRPWDDAPQAVQAVVVSVR
jgi:predicted secreted protein